MRRRRKEYSRWGYYRKKSVGGRGLTRGLDRDKAVRNLLIGFPLILLAAGVVILSVYGYRKLRDRAAEREAQRMAQIYAQQQGGADVSHLNDSSAGQDNPNGNYDPDGQRPGENSSGNGSVSPSNGTGNTPQPTQPSALTSPVPSTVSSPDPLAEPTPEPTTNGHEFDDVMVIAIDAGHGGYDGGSVSGSVIEKDINLAVAQEIARLLEEHGGITVVRTRDSDVFVSKQDRCNIANAAKCDYFVSVHCNTYESDSSVHGFECHYNEKSSEGAVFAQAVSKDMKQYTDMKIRSDKPNNLAVTTHTYCPAILIEMGFLTNPTECANLADSDYQKKLAERIVKAVLKAAGL